MSLHQVNVYLMNTSALCGTMTIKAPTPGWAKEREKVEAEAARALADERSDRKVYVNQSQYDEIVAVDPSMADDLVVIRPAS